MHSYTSGRLLEAATATSIRMLRYTLVAVIILTLVSAQIALAAPTIYVDTRAIDARKDMTEAEKSAVKTAMMNEIKSNLESAFGSGSVTVTDDAAQAGTADRSVNVDAGIGQETDGDGNTGYYWGEWEHGSSSTTVQLGTYMDSPATNNSDDFKSGDPPQWDTAKLGKALGTTAAHEIAHSYSAGHDDRPAAPGVANPNKMNSANSSSQIGGGLPLNQGAKDTLTANKGKPPCKTTTDYKNPSLLARWWADFCTMLDKLFSEAFSVTANWNFGGPAASFFDIGWWGVDTDGGAIDGNPWADFIYKSSMTGTLGDSPTITMFDGWTCHFVLRGRPDSPYPGQLFPVESSDMILGDIIVRPDGTEVGRQLTLRWDVDNDGIYDVTVNLQTSTPPNSPYNGFQLGIAPPISLGEAKQSLDGTYAHMANVQVTSVFNDSFYVQAADRSSGIGVSMLGGIPTPPLFLGMDINLCGKLTGGNTERGICVIDPADIVLCGIIRPLRPLGMSNRNVGGGDFHYIPGIWASGQRGIQGGVGTNNIGLLIRTWGRIVEIEHALPPAMPTWLKIDDGTGTPIKCVAEEGKMLIDPAMIGQYAVVTGVSSCEADGDTVIPRIRMTELHLVH